MSDWDIVAASSGPLREIPIQHETQDGSVTMHMPIATYHEHINGSVRCGKRLGYAECQDTHRGMLRAAYRAGELAGLVTALGAALVLAVWAWVLGGRRR